MQRSTLLRWSYANILTKRRYDVLKDAFSSLDEALAECNADMLRLLKCRDDTIELVLKRMASFDEADYEKKLDESGIELISIEEDSYPTILRTIDDPPIFLYFQGSIDILSHPGIALVGTRKMSLYGRRVTDELVSGLVSADIVTVSGLAYGIDSEVARATIELGGKTIAVLGHGLSMMYPVSNRALAQAIIKQGGLIMSEFPLDTHPDKFTFPARNRIIAGLTMATVVIEAAAGSGSLITADLALDYNRQVFAVPGQIFDDHYSGCHELIAQGRAKLVTGAEEILTDIGCIAPSRPLSGDRPRLESVSEKAVWQALSSMPQCIDDLLKTTGLTTAEIAATLTLLEMRSLASPAGDGTWVKG